MQNIPEPMARNISKVVKFDQIAELSDDNKDTRSSRLMDVTRTSFLIDTGSNNEDDDCVSNDADTLVWSPVKRPALLPTKMFQDNPLTREVSRNVPHIICDHCNKPAKIQLCSTQNFN